MGLNMLIVLLISLGLVVHGLGVGFQQASTVQDLAGLGLPSPNVRVTETMHKVIKMMQDVEKLPSCQKQASQTLLDSCSDFDRVNSMAGQHTTEKILQKAKSVYAARLAICELTDADKGVPPSCAPFMPVGNSNAAGLRGYINIGRSNKHQIYHKDSDLHDCLQSLASNSVWWTSYSNARQTALLMCHTMRSELDKDDMLHKTKLMFEAVMEAHNIQTDTNQESRIFEQKWNEMSKGMESFHVALNSDLESHNKIMQQWAQFRDSVQNLENNIRDLGRDVDRVREVSSDMISDLEKHRSHAQAAHDDISQQVDQILESSVAIDRVQRSSLSNSMVLDQQGRELANFLLQTISTVEALNQDSETLAYLVTNLMENMTDAARIVSEFREDLDSFPISMLSHVPLGVVALLAFTCCICFAVLHTWGPFNSTGSLVAALGSGSGLTYIAFEIAQALDSRAFDLLRLLAFVLFVSFAMFACSLWYRQQYAVKEMAQVDHTKQSDMQVKTSTEHVSSMETVL